MDVVRCEQNTIYFRRCFLKSFSVALPEGFGCMLSANLFFSLMATSVYAVSVLDSNVSSFMVSFVRVIVNLFVILVPALCMGKGKQLWGDYNWTLWLRGIFGCLALMLFFLSIRILGQSESTFIQSVNGIFIIALCPLVLGERFSSRMLFSVIGSIIGLCFLFSHSFSDGKMIGQMVALASGVFATGATLMVAKAGKKNTKETIVWYFCFVAIFIHFAYFATIGRAEVILPKGYLVWIAMSGAGIFSSFGQLLMTKAYQIASAPTVVAVGYTGPVLNTIWGIVFFGQLLTGKALIGCSIILFCGILLPFLKGKEKSCTAIDPVRKLTGVQSDYL